MKVRVGQRLTVDGFTFVVRREHLRQVLRERSGLTPQAFAAEFEHVVKTLALANDIHRRYDQDFSQARVGDWIRVRVPKRFEAR